MFWVFLAGCFFARHCLREAEPDCAPIYDAHLQSKFLNGHHMPECADRKQNKVVCEGCWAR